MNGNIQKELLYGAIKFFTNYYETVFRNNLILVGIEPTILTV